MKVTETEYVEKEVKRVYCDDCGNECTKRHYHVRKELCNNCTDLSVMERVTANVPDIVPQRAYPHQILNVGTVIESICIYPLIFIFTMNGMVRRDHAIEESDKLLVAIHALGGLLYGIGIGVVLHVALTI